MLSSYSNFGILLMAGKGSRYNKETPKQYTPYKGIPLFLHAYKALAISPNIDAIICVIGENEEGLARDFIASINASKPTYFVVGGATRTESVINAVNFLKENGVKDDALLLIHDAARPNLEENYIEEGLQKAKEAGASVTCYPSSDSVSLGNGTNLTKYLDRREIYIISTPQTFYLKVISKALSEKDDKEYTDDGSLVLDVLGIKPLIVHGKRSNIKITFPGDIS